MKVPTAVRWAALALLGILVAAAVSVAASRLASRQVGLASEPISAGDALAPAQPAHHAATAPKRGSGGQSNTPKPAPSAPIQPPVEPVPTPSPPLEATEPGHTNGDGEHSDGGADD